MSKQESINKLNGRDFINIGIYAAIYFVIVMVLAMTGLIPIFLILLSSMIGIIGGIPFMLFLTKVKKPGMILIMSTVMGILMFVTGMTWMPIPFSIVTGWERRACSCAPDRPRLRSCHLPWHRRCPA